MGKTTYQLVQDFSHQQDDHPQYKELIDPGTYRRWKSTSYFVDSVAMTLEVQLDSTTPNKWSKQWGVHFDFSTSLIDTKPRSWLVTTI